MMRLRRIAITLFLGLVYIPALTLAAADESSDSLAEPPDAATQSALLKQVRDAYEPLYRVKSATSSQARAIKLLEEQAKLTDEPTTQYVLLTEAHDAAIEAGEFQLVLKAISAIETNYRVDGVRLKANALTAITRSLTPNSAAAYTECAMDLARQTLVKEDITQGMKFISQAESGLRRVKDTDAVTSLRQDMRTTKELLVLIRRIDGMRSRLLQDADNAEAISMIGKYDYFVKKDRMRGLAVLARSKNTTLKTIADLEMTTRRTSTEWNTLGDSWLKLAKSEKVTVFREPMAKRAIYWYDQAVSEASSLRATIIRNNIGEAYKAAGLPAGYRKLTDLEREKLVRYGDKWYLFVDQPVGWPAASKWCADRQGTLVSIRSAAENRFLWQLVRQTYPNSPDPLLWLGASDKAKEGVWRWEDGSRMTYRNWFTGQPDNHGGSEHYAMIFQHGKGMWNDGPAHQQLHFIAQWKLK